MRKESNPNQFEKLLINTHTHTKQDPVLSIKIITCESIINDRPNLFNIDTRVNNWKCYVASNQASIIALVTIHTIQIIINFIVFNPDFLSNETIFNIIT